MNLNGWVSVRPSVHGNRVREKATERKPIPFRQRFTQVKLIFVCSIVV